MVRHGATGADVQDAISQCWSFTAPYVSVVLPPEVIDLSDTLHLTDPTKSAMISPAVSLVGARPNCAGYDNNTVLRAQFNDRPVLQANRARHLHLANFEVRGQNDYSASLFNGLYPAPAFFNDATFLMPGVTPAHIGIDIDNDPSNTSGSSGIVVDNVSLKYLAGGFAVARNGVAQNGEGITLNRVRTYLTGLYGFGFGNDQTKGNTMRDCSGLGCKYWLDCVTIGANQGYAPIIYGGRVNLTARVFNIHGTKGVFRCDGLFTEVVGGIGTIGHSNNSANGPAVFTGCHWHLMKFSDAQNIDVSAYLWRPTKFEGCWFQGEQGETTAEWRILNADHVTFDTCYWRNNGLNGHVPISFHLPGKVEFRHCISRIDGARQTLHGTLTQTDTQIGSGSITLSSVAGTDKATFTQTGHGLDVGDLVKLDPLDELLVESNPSQTNYRASLPIGIVDSVSGDDVTIKHVARTLSLPHTGNLYRRRVAVS